MNHVRRKERRKDISEYASEHSLFETARIFGVSSSTVQKSCREHGINPRRERTWQPLLSKFGILWDLLQGMNAIDVSNKYNCTRQYVSLIRIEAKKVGFEV